jgi:major structural subunit of bundle-forming pilus
MVTTKTGLGKVFTAMRRTTRKAVSLIEIAMGLSIIAVVGAGALFYFNNASVSARTNEAMQQLSSLQEIIRTLYQSAGNYSGLSASVVANSSLLAPRYRVGTIPNATAVRSPFGSNVNFASANNDTEFEITLLNVPASACQRLATVDLGSGLRQITVGDLTVTGGVGLTPAQANANCAAAGTNITWRFI